MVVPPARAPYNTAPAPRGFPIPSIHSPAFLPTSFSLSLCNPPLSTLHPHRSRFPNPSTPDNPRQPPHTRRCRLSFLALDEGESLTLADSVDAASLVAVEDAVMFIGDVDEFRAEGGANELAVFVARAKALDHVRDGRAVLRVQVCVYFVK